MVVPAGGFTPDLGDSLGAIGNALGDAASAVGSWIPRTWAFGGGRGGSGPSDPDSTSNGKRGEDGPQTYRPPKTGSGPQKPQFDVQNGPLNPRAESDFRLGYDKFGLRRGCMIRTHRDASARQTRIVDPKNRYKFQFLYNPAQIDFGNAAFGGVVPPQYKNTNDNLIPMFVGQESCSFTLLLDRTQDAYEQGLKTRGTLDDVEALYRVINGDQGSQAGFLSMSGVEIHWGPSTQNGRPLQPFPCFVTSLSISHTHFTPRMCPIRTALTISASRIVGSNTSASSVFTSAQASLGGG